MLGNQPFLVNLSFSLREWLSKPAERTNTIVLLNAGPTGQDRASALARFHFIKEKEPFTGVGEHGLCQPQLPREFPEPADHCPDISTYPGLPEEQAVSWRK